MSHKFSDFFFPKLKKNIWKPKKVIHVVAYNLIKIQTGLAPQSEHQNLSFVKDIHVVGKKMTRNDHKIAKCKGCDI